MAVDVVFVRDQNVNFDGNRKCSLNTVYSKFGPNRFGPPTIRGKSIADGYKSIGVLSTGGPYSYFYSRLGQADCCKLAPRPPTGAREYTHGNAIRPAWSTFKNNIVQKNIIARRRKSSVQ